MEAPLALVVPLRGLHSTEKSKHLGAVKSRANSTVPHSRKLVSLPLLAAHLSGFLTDTYLSMEMHTVE